MRRFAHERGLTIFGPKKIFDSTLSLIGGLYTLQPQFKEGNNLMLFKGYTDRVFERFFKRQLDLVRKPIGSRFSLMESMILY